MINNLKTQKIKEFQEIGNYVNGFLTSNIDSIYVNTESLDYKRYVILLRQIAKKRIETGRITRTNWITKEIEVKMKSLNEKQLKSMYWILENKNYVDKRVKKLVNKFKNGKVLIWKPQKSKNKSQEILSYFD